MKKFTGLILIAVLAAVAAPLMAEPAPDSGAQAASVQNAELAPVPAAGTPFTIETAILTGDMRAGWLCPDYQIVYVALKGPNADPGILKSARLCAAHTGASRPTGRATPPERFTFDGHGRTLSWRAIQYPLIS